MSSPSRREDRYYEKITSIQQSMHQREKRRLELERELFVYSRSDTRILQIKCSKLRSYLKEISNREDRAKMRNLELLRDVECIEISIKEYSPDHGPLEQQKADFFKKISKCMAERKKMEKGLEAAKTSRASDAGTTSVHSPQAMCRSPNRSVHSRERLPSGLLKDFRVGEEEATSNRTRLSDNISGSNDSPDGCNLSDKHERKMAVLPSVSALTGASGNAPFESDDEQEPLHRVNLTGPQRNPSPGSRVPMTAKDSPAEDTKSLKMAHQPPIMEAGGRSLSLLMPEHTSGKGAQESPDSKISQVIRVSTPGSDVELSESSASDLSVSLTQSELSDDVESERNATSGGSDALNQHSLESPIHSDGSKKTAVTLESLSQEGIFNLLDSIEGRLHGEWTRLYGDSSIDGRQLNRLIGLCNVGAGLNDEDLGACGAVVLHELQRLSWSTAKGCLLSQELVSSHQSSSDPKEISASLPPDAARLWDRWFKHALLLKERRVLNTERLVQLFTPLLLERHASYSHQAKVLLRTLLSRSSEECPSAEDESDLSSSCDPSSLLVDRHVKPARSAQQQQIQELQSAEEDSQDESPVESVPIRETKAYQLLKQSAMQERQQSSEEEEEEEEVDGLSGINHGHEEDLGRAKRSSHQDPYPGTEKTNSKARSALKSKALWGESDDSYSEIEAALRPQPFNTNNDDIDDFYD
ncbi:centrosomal protein kizuna isoform X2 [Platichthys flesus]|uniref:centrosomal protein kizuna isoform X2 n=1 Tax=Platichthys flesus TaxID=8260 RepID=UPI002DBE4C84|nr:centrosomal protein kizuna isoform X2 [Platichthys flesus]